MDCLVYVCMSRNVKSSNWHTHHLLDLHDVYVCMRAHMCTCVYEDLESILLTIISYAH